MTETSDTARLTQIRDRSERLAAIPMETAAEHYVMRDMIDSIGDVRWLLERVEQMEREAFAAALDTGPGAWCWNRHPDYPLPCGRFAGHDGQHVRGEHRWDDEQQPEDSAESNTGDLVRQFETPDKGEPPRGPQNAVTGMRPEGGDRG